MQLLNKLSTKNNIQKCHCHILKWSLRILLTLPLLFTNIAKQTKCITRMSGWGETKLTIDTQPFLLWLEVSARWRHGGDKACLMEKISNGAKLQSHNFTIKLGKASVPLIPTQPWSGCKGWEFRQKSRTCHLPFQAQPLAGKCWRSCFNSGHLWSLQIPGAGHIRKMLCDPTVIFIKPPKSLDCPLCRKPLTAN